KGEACHCTNYRMIHPHRRFKDEFGVMVNDTLTTCGWHAKSCVASLHGDAVVPITTANEGALCNECLITKGHPQHTTIFAAPGVRTNDRNDKRGDDQDADNFMVWNKWFIKGPGRLRQLVLQPRHPNAPLSEPPAGLRPIAIYKTPPPPPPLLSVANFRKRLALSRWQVRCFGE
ncbi:unnamed protein product, partial [Choristocarpus tenellus]